MRWSELVLFCGLLVASMTNSAADEWTDVHAYRSRGFKADNKRDYTTARRNLDGAVNRYPKNAFAHYNRGLFFLEHHEYERALDDFNAAVVLRPGYWEYARWRSVVYADLGKYDLALADLNRVLSFHPVHDQFLAHLLNDRAWIEATCPDARYRNGKQAIEDATFAVRFGRYYKASFLDTLAAAYAETGDFDSAAKYEEQAIAAQTKTDKLRDANGAVNAYRQHHAYRVYPKKAKAGATATAGRFDSR
jgi:tetratricopeptide (TPR) repeat protein